MDELTVMMLGSMGVGKTSCLATMYQEITALPDGSSAFDLLVDDDETKHYLQDALTDMRKVNDQHNFTEIVKVLQGTPDIFQNNFTLNLEDKPYLKLRFYDIPGGFMRITPKDSDYSRYIQIRDTADVFFNVVDGASLVAGSDAYFEEKSTPLLIQEVVNQVIRRRKKALFLFVVTKCERWLRSSIDIKLMNEKFNERYARVLALFKNSNNIAAVMIPVKTMGCVEYNTWDKKQNKPIFMKMNVNATFNPEHIDQPLRYIMTFALARAYENWSWWTNFKYHLTGKQRRYKEAFTDFAKGRHQNFLTYGEHRLLGLTHNSLKK